MDPNSGTFHELDTDGMMDGHPVPENWPIFKVGEKVVIKRHVFQVVKVGTNTLSLEPVKKASPRWRKKRKWKR